MQETIAQSRLVEAGLFRREVLERLLDEHVSGRIDHNYRLWMIFNLEVFWRLYIDGDSVAAIEDWIHDARRGRAADGAAQRLAAAQ